VVKNTTVLSAVSWSNVSQKLVHYIEPVFLLFIVCMSFCTQNCLGSPQSVLEFFSLKLFGNQKKKNQKDIHIS